MPYFWGFVDFQKKGGAGEKRKDDLKLLLWSSLITKKRGELKRAPYRTLVDAGEVRGGGGNMHSGMGKIPLSFEPPFDNHQIRDSGTLVIFFFFFRFFFFFCVDKFSLLQLDKNRKKFCIIFVFFVEPQ